MMFANQSALSRNELERYAVRVGGIDLAQFRQAIATDAHATTIAADRRAARAVGVRGTPAILIGGQLIRGARPFLEIEEAIDDALDR